MPTFSRAFLWQNPETGEIYYEVPQGSGRRKISLPKDKRKWGEILAKELSTQTLWLKAIEAQKKSPVVDEEKLKRAEKKAEKAATNRHHFIYDTTARNHGVPMAKRTIGPRNKNQIYIPPIRKLMEGEI